MQRRARPRRRPPRRRVHSGRGGSSSRSACSPTMASRSSRTSPRSAHTPWPVACSSRRTGTATSQSPGSSRRSLSGRARSCGSTPVGRGITVMVPRAGRRAPAGTFLPLPRWQGKLNVFFYGYGGARRGRQERKQQRHRTDLLTTSMETDGADSRGASRAPTLTRCLWIDRTLNGWMDG